jgi:hypothetical protein|tara:strand:- start:549 stop:869 length:321 start_codon:yes stop_codon:yes gene_type:complete
MGASHSSTTLSEALAGCDPSILKYVLGQPGSHIKEIFLRFVEIGKQTTSAKKSTLVAVMENAEQFSRIFTATNNDHNNWISLFERLDSDNSELVDFYEAIATVVSS